MSVADLAEWARRCAVCGWLLSDAEAHVAAMYEDHGGEAEPARAWRDRHGDVWQLGGDGMLHTPETAPFPREHVEKKWGPLSPLLGSTNTMTREELTDWLRLEGTVETERTCTALIPKFNTIGRIDVECSQQELVWVHIVGDKTIWQCTYCNTDHEGELDDLVDDLVR